jgi:hypothetical protein
MKTDKEIRAALREFTFYIQRQKGHGLPGYVNAVEAAPFYAALSWALGEDGGRMDALLNQIKASNASACAGRN